MCNLRRLELIVTSIQSPWTYAAFTRSGEEVYIKSVPLHGRRSAQWRIWKYLTQGPQSLDPRNHTVPFREVLKFNPDFETAGFTPEKEDERLFVVMQAFEPLCIEDLEGFHYPLLNTGAAFLDMSQQLVEVGLNGACFPATAFDQLCPRQFLSYTPMGLRTW